MGFAEELEAEENMSIEITKRRFLTATTAAGLTAGLATGLGVGISGVANAQPFPAKPIKVILPYTPGSPNDVIARVMAPLLSTRLGQPVVIDNRPGGGTAIGLKNVMASDPDGYTLLFTNTPTHVIAQLVSKGFTYDPVKDFAPIVAVGNTSLLLVVPPSLPVNTVQEFIAYAKARPGQLNFGFGQGTLPHLVGEAFKLVTQTDIASIPYRGGAQAVTDMLGGRIHMNLGAGATLVPLIKDGRIKALAATSEKRSRELPDVPTMAESGLPTLTTVTYYGFLAPAGTPTDVITRINTEVNQIITAQEVKDAMIKVGFEPVGGPPQDFAALIAAQLERWAPIVKATGFQMD
jgi:tripartite-type tricarboxylate transporter receptor subunit TctC